MCCENDKIELKAIEDKLNELKSHVSEKVKPIEKCIGEHPIPSVLVAAGAGILIGVIASKIANKGE
jgi:ElaB/YqjD/DUF883 family membrane-anchored ribosome-binding protein